MRWMTILIILILKVLFLLTSFPQEAVIDHCYPQMYSLSLVLPAWYLRPWNYFVSIKESLSRLFSRWPLGVLPLFFLDSFLQGGLLITLCGFLWRIYICIYHIYGMFICIICTYICIYMYACIWRLLLNMILVMVVVCKRSVGLKKKFIKKYFR